MKHKYSLTTSGYPSIQTMSLYLFDLEKLFSNDEVCIIFRLENSILDRALEKYSIHHTTPHQDSGNYIRYLSNIDLHKLTICIEFQGFYADFLKHDNILLNDLISGYILREELRLENKKLDIDNFNEFIFSCMIKRYKKEDIKAFSKAFLDIIIQSHFQLNARWCDYQRLIKRKKPSRKTLILEHSM